MRICEEGDVVESREVRGCEKYFINNSGISTLFDFRASIIRNTFTRGAQKVRGDDVSLMCRVYFLMWIM